MSNSIYCITGTGLDIDGCLVTKEHLHHIQNNNFYSVKLLNQETAVGSFLIHEKYLCEITSKLPKYTYSITIYKKSSFDNDAPEEGIVLTFKDVVKNIDMNVFKDHLEKWLMKGLYK